MGRKKGTCVYCGLVGTLTDEHVLPSWIAALLPAGGRFETVTTGADGKLVRHFESIEQLGLIAHVVCASCNGGWMERLETSARRYLVPMIVGLPTTLDAPAFRTLARWTAKTHQMYRCQLRRLPTSRAFAAVYRGHVPRATFVLAASWRGREEAFVVHNPRRQVITKIGVPNGPTTDEIFYSELLTLRIGHAVLQTFEIATRRNDWRVPVHPSELNYVRPIWPPAPLVFAWPPPLALDDRGFDRFDHRLRSSGGAPTFPRHEPASR